MIVGVSGAAGAMGRTAAAAIAAAEGLEVGPLYDPFHVGEVVEGVEVTGDRQAMTAAEVVVEFTSPTVVMDNLAEWRRLSVHAVVGTSGFDSEKLERLRVAWGEGPPNCLVVPNFSIGAILMMRFAEAAAPHFRAAEIIESHHPRKVDAPSGTAIATAERIAAARRVPQTPSDPAPARGALISGVPVHALRLAGVLADQVVIFGNDGETLTVSHHTSDRTAFMPGLLLAIRNIEKLAAVSVGLEQLLAP